MTDKRNLWKTRDVSVHLNAAPALFVYSTNNSMLLMSMRMFL